MSDIKSEIKKKKRVKADFRGRAMAWLFLMCALLGCLLWVTLRRVHYFSYWNGNIRAQVFGVSSGVFDAIPRALNGDLDALRLTMRDGEGQEKQVFTELEIAHMGDVAELYRLAKIVMCVFGAMFLALLLWTGFRCWRKKKWTGVAEGALRGARDVMLLYIAVFLWVLIDFRSAFWAFRRIVFANDLWLLDPNGMLIQLMPESFFQATFFKMGTYWICFFAGLWNMCWQAVRKKAEAKE
ncbi:MAG: DUF1461 domain-containing protein [Clostridia bacterium]|nr:DUF1461 domain-containing protein [Clostridia bacterium]